MWAYAAHISKEDQEGGFMAAIHFRVVFRPWINLSIWLLNSGWWPENRIIVVPNSLQKVPQNYENQGPWSFTTYWCIPKTWLHSYRWLQTKSAVFLTVGSLGKEMNLQPWKICRQWRICWLYLTMVEAPWKSPWRGATKADEGWAEGGTSLRGTTWSFPLVAYRAGRHKSLDILLNDWPQEAPLEELKCAGCM